MGSVGGQIMVLWGGWKKSDTGAESAWIGFIEKNIYILEVWLDARLYMYLLNFIYAAFCPAGSVHMLAYIYIFSLASSHIPNTCI